MRQRRFLKESRNIGFSAAVSGRALNVASLISLRVLLHQLGTNPQRIGTTPRLSISEAQGRRREAGSEGSVEQNRGSMDKHRITRPTRPDERAKDREVHGHQGPGW